MQTFPQLLLCMSNRDNCVIDRSVIVSPAARGAVPPAETCSGQGAGAFAGRETELDNGFPREGRWGLTPPTTHRPGQKLLFPHEWGPAFVVSDLVSVQIFQVWNPLIMRVQGPLYLAKLLLIISYY